LFLRVAKGVVSCCLGSQQFCRERNVLDASLAGSLLQGMQVHLSGSARIHRSKSATSVVRAANRRSERENPNKSPRSTTGMHPAIGLFSLCGSIDEVCETAQIRDYCAKRLRSETDLAANKLETDALLEYHKLRQLQDLDIEGTLARIAAAPSVVHEILGPALTRIATDATYRSMIASKYQQEIVPLLSPLRDTTPRA
jgi:hypothetical protein